MLGLPLSTEVKKRIPKEAIFRKFNVNSQEKAKFNADIKSITIVNEIMPNTIPIQSGEEVSELYFMQIILKNKTFDEKNLIMLSKLIEQKMIFVLQFEDMIKLVIHYLKLFQTDWHKLDEYKIELQGLTLDAVWENLILKIADTKLEMDRTLDQQIAINEERRILQNKIAKLEAQAWRERQPKKKFEIVQEINKLKIEINKGKQNV